MLDSGDTRARQHARDRLVADFAKLDKKLNKKATRKKPKFPGGRTLVRFYEMQRGCRDRYGPTFPEGDDGALDDLGILASCAIAAGLQASNIIKKAAPWMLEVDWFLNNMVDRSVAFLKADPMADRIGWVNYELHQRLNFRTIGSTDVRKAEREELNRQRKEAKRKAERAAKPKKPKLTMREKAIIKIVKTSIAMADLIAKAEKSIAFRGLKNVRTEVHRVAKRLEKAGILGMRLEPRRGERRQREFYLWNEHSEDMPISQGRPADATPNVPNFTEVLVSQIGAPMSPKETLPEEDADFDLDALDDEDRDTFLADPPLWFIQQLMTTAPGLAGAPPGVEKHQIRLERQDHDIKDVRGCADAPPPPLRFRHGSGKAG